MSKENASNVLTIDTVDAGKFYTKKDTAEIFGLSVKWVEAQMANDRIRYFKFSGAVKLKGIDIINFSKKSEIDNGN